MKIKCTGEKPSYANMFAAGLDIKSNEDITIAPGEVVKLDTQLAVEIPIGHFGMVVARSGLAFKHRIKLLNDVGIIDEDYRGNIGVMLVNEGSQEYTISKGDRVAQMIVIPYKQVKLEYVDELSETERGEGGFGHTGK